MGDYYEKLTAWRKLQKILTGIPDPDLRKTYHDTFLLKAMAEWGFNPERPEKLQPEVVKLNEEEQKIADRIKAWNEYGIDIQNGSTEQEMAKRAMWEFVKSGGSLCDLPEDLRNSKFIFNLYFETVKKVYDVK